KESSKSAVIDADSLNRQNSSVKSVSFCSTKVNTNNKHPGMQIPTFDTLKPYTPEGLNLKQLGLFMDKTFSGRLNEEKIKPIRDMWPRKLVLKGVASEGDAQRAIDLGLDGIIVSNHGGRQLDAGQSAIKPLASIAEKY
ncbi:MAG: alpha-hydroxy-acid oxidizing protein, partial [Opitutae bacterium]